MTALKENVALWCLAWVMVLDGFIIIITFGFFPPLLLGRCTEFFTRRQWVEEAKDESSAN
jgi:hypothetical protein